MAAAESSGIGQMGRGPHVKDFELIAAIRACEHPIVTTAEIQQRCALDSNDQLLKRLDDLRERGELGGRTAGRQKIWWLPGTVCDVRER